jgi:hypothetical protein
MPLLLGLSELYEDTQYLKLSTFIYTCHISNGYHKGNVIRKDAKDWLEWIDEH